MVKGTFWKVLKESPHFKEFFLEITNFFGEDLGRVLVFFF